MTSNVRQFSEDEHPHSLPFPTTHGMQVVSRGGCGETVLRPTRVDQFLLLLVLKGLFTQYY